MNIIFIEPSFPYNQREFVRGLAEAGASIIGIGERPQEHLADDVKQWLSHYVQVQSVVHEPSLLRAVQQIQGLLWLLFRECCECLLLFGVGRCIVF